MKLFALIFLGCFLGVSGEATYPRLASYHQGTIDYAEFTEADDAAVNDWIVLHWQPGLNPAQVRTWVQRLQATHATLKPGRPPMVVFLYTISDECPPGATGNTFKPLKDVLDVQNLWAHNTFPGAADLSDVAEIWPGYIATNEAANIAITGGTLTLGSWWRKWIIDSWGLSTIPEIKGIMCDNWNAKPLVGYDWNRDGNPNSPDAAFRLAVQQQRQSAGTYIKGRGYLLCSNSSYQNAVGDYWSNGTDTRAAVTAFGLDYNIIETPIGESWGCEGVLFYSTSMSYSGFRTWPGNQPFSAAPALGTPVQNTWGQYHNTATPPNAGSTGIYDMCKGVAAIASMADLSHIVLQAKVPAPSRIGSWTGVAKALRYSALFTQVMTPFSTDLKPQDNGSPRKTIRLDELEFEWGLAIDPPQTIADEVADGVNKREFQNALVYVYHRRGHGASETFPTRTVTLPSAGTGKKWQRVNAAAFFNQDPATNTGLDQGATYQFAGPRDGIVFRRVNTSGTSTEQQIPEAINVNNRVHQVSRIYDISGRRVLEPRQSGIYLYVTGNKIKKRVYLR